MPMTKLSINLSGLDVLVVEDDEMSALLTSRALTMHGAQVETAPNGIDGLLKFKERRFPIVITDINMPEMDGLELAHNIKSLHPDTYIIATSVNSESGCLITALELGFSDYFLKPVSIEKLLLAVKKCGDVIALKRQLEYERGKFRAVVDCLGEGIAIKDLDYRILYQNRTLTEMFGDFTGSACYEMFGYTAPCQNCPTILALQDGQSHSACKNSGRNDSHRHIESTASLVRDAHGCVSGTVAIIRDISERIKNEETIRDMAFHDSLTGLSNRRLFEDRLEQAIAKSRRYGMKFGLLYMDLDCFKYVNDTFGHEAGDDVLIEASERIRSCCKRDLDTISRQGGDEFCVIITDCGNRNELDEIAANLLLAFREPFRVQSSGVLVTTSIGISIFPDDGITTKALESAADKAMYTAKHAGRNTRVFFDALPQSGVFD